MRYPIGSQLVSRLVDYLQGKDDPHLTELGFENNTQIKPFDARARAIVRVIARVLKQYFAIELSGVGQVDVAEFFTMAHTLAEHPLLFGQALVEDADRTSSARDEPSETSLFQNLAAVTRSYFTEICSLEEAPDDVRSVFAEIDPRKHAIVNFNWDEELDFELTRGPDVAYTLESWRVEGGVLMLRPHGSVGWYDIKHPVVVFGDEVHLVICDTLPRSKQRILAFDEIELPDDINGDEHSPMECPPMITPPTFAKRFEYVEQYYIWQDVLRVCADADEFVFLGYSLPRDDYLTRAAIRSALREREKGRRKRNHAKLKPMRERNRFRCLIVDLDLEPSKLLNFQSVFGEGLTRGHNYLPCRFGVGDGTLRKHLEEKLKEARLLS